MSCHNEKQLHATNAELPSIKKNAELLVIAVHAPKKHTVVFWVVSRTNAGSRHTLLRLQNIATKTKKVGFRHATNTGGLAVGKKHSLQS